MEFYRSDCESILSQIKHQEKQLKLKRRWLMGLPKSKYEQKQFKEPVFLKCRYLPESLLREDDIFYDSVKASVEEAFGACKTERGPQADQDSMQLINMPNIRKFIFSHFDEFTNKGLYLLAMALTGGSVKFEKTCWKMKKVIRESMSIVLRNRYHNNQHQSELVTQLSQILNDPYNFQENCKTSSTPTYQSHHAAVIKVLDGLGDLPSETLIAMRRKLRGVQGGIPQLKPRKNRWNRDHLINQLRTTSEDMLSQLGEGDELQEPLAKAMAVANLSLKLTLDCQNYSCTQFWQFSPEIETLQNEITKAIRLLRKKVRFAELKNLQLLFDPNTEVSNGNLRTAIKKMLTEYLFECGDMDIIPKSLLESLAIINSCQRKPHRCFQKEEIEEEVDCILSVSGQTKQLVLDMLPGHEFDQDFNDAYMDDLEESDDGDGYDDDDYADEQMKLNSSQSSRSCFHDSNNQLESTGESKPIDLQSPTSTTKVTGSSPLFTPSRMLNTDPVGKYEPESPDHVMDSVNSHGIFSSSIFQGSKSFCGTVNPDKNTCQVECMGRFSTSGTKGNGFYPLVSPNGRLNAIEKHEPECNTGKDPANLLGFFPSDLSCGEAKFMPTKQSTCKNNYLAMQEVCDKTSMVAYNLIGHMLEEFAEIRGLNLDLSDSLYLSGQKSLQELLQAKSGGQTFTEEDNGGSVIVCVVEELIPSFPKSGMERLKKLMSS